MRIAIVLNTSWNIYNFRLGLVKTLLEEGHDVVAIAPKDEYTSKLIDLGCSFEEVKMDSRGANPLKDFGLTFELFRIYRRQKPDVILHYTIKPNIYGTIAASLLRLPAINNVCGLGTSFLNKNLVSRIALALYKIAFKFPKLVYFQNKDDKDFFLSAGLIKKDKTDILPGSGINTNKFIPSVENKEQKPFTFLLISRLIYDKGIVEYIDAIKILKAKGVDARFQLLGKIDEFHTRGIEKELVDTWVEQKAVDYLGSTDDVKPFIQNSDCVVLPSYREGTPRSLLEAASSGKPIITTDVAGCRNVVDDNVNGYLCKVQDPIDLANKLEKMISQDSQTVGNMGKASREIAINRFDEQIVIDKYLDSISKV
ncbi:MAG: glycosyltransferase family 4 protein [Bacteroidota bacterium]